MAQGKMKVKSKLPSGKKKRSQPKKPQIVLKKGLYIKPRKAPKVEAEKLRKNLEKSINQNIESQLRSRALSQDGKEFKIKSKSSNKLNNESKKK